MFIIVDEKIRKLKSNKFDVFNKKKKKVSRQATFQDALRLVIVVGQIFALNPVSGITMNKESSIRFKWFSWRCFYTLISLCGQTFITVMCIIRTFNSKTSLESATSIIFYGTTCLTMIIFLKMATQWPKLTSIVASTEFADANFDRQLVYRCNCTCAIVLSFALIEHMLSLVAAFVTVKTCHPDLNLYESFVKHMYPWVFKFIPYSFMLGIITQFLHSQSTFIWNFSDLFIICMSYYLTSRLGQINQRLKKAQGKYLPESFWRSIREDYTRVTDLVRRVDDIINGAVFISFANNLFFICLQLFNTMENGIRGQSHCPEIDLSKLTVLIGYEQAAYFLYSLIFLILRSIAVSLVASQVHSASLVPAPVLYDVPSSSYCTEVQRFLDQVNTDNVTLTGLQFFSVTRGLLLTVAGTIVTYELVMVQFNTSSSQPTQITSTSTMPPYSVLMTGLAPLRLSHVAVDWVSVRIQNPGLGGFRCSTKNV